MLDIIDWSMAMQISVATAAVMQILKTKPPFDRLDGEYLAATVGVIIGIYFCLVTPHVESHWIDWLQCGATGLVAGVAASGAYNIQKALPMSNMFPTKTEKKASHLP